MAKFTGKNIEFKDGQKAIFGDSDDSYIAWDGSAAELLISTIVSGVDPTNAGHLTTKQYVDVAITTATGSLTSDHGDLTGLEDDDHTMYVPTDGSRGFTNTVSGVDPTQDYHLTTKDYVDAYVSTATSGTGGARFFAYDAAGGTAYSSAVTWVDVTFDTEVIETSEFTHASGTAEVTINTAGLYQVSYYVDCKATTTVKDTAFDARITIDTGSGYGDLAGSHATNSTRGDGDMTTKPIGTASLIMLAEFDSGDKIKVQMKMSDVLASTGQTEANSCGLVIVSVASAGPAGADGADGADGVDGALGPAGSGSTINVNSDGSPVSGTPFEVLNFAGFSLSQTASGTVTISGAGSLDHSDLNELDYASSGHTGFQPAGDYATNSQLTTTSGDIVDQIPTDYYTQAEVDTISGSLDAAKEDAFSKNTAFNKDFGITNTTVASGSHTHESSGSSTFGSEYDYNSSDAESSTTSDTPQQKVRLTTASLPSGTYHIEWGYEFSIDDDKDSDFNAQTQINDTTTIAAQGGNKTWKWDDGVWVAESGFYNAVLSGVLNIDIDYWDSGATGVNIRRARVVIWRVA